MNMKKMYLLSLIALATITVGAAEKRVVARNDFYSSLAPATTGDRGTRLDAEVVDATQDDAKKSRCCRLWDSVKRNKKRVAAVGCLAVATAYPFRDPIFAALGLQQADGVVSSRKMMSTACTPFDCDPFIEAAENVFKIRARSCDYYVERTHELYTTVEYWLRVCLKKNPAIAPQTAQKCYNDVIMVAANRLFDCKNWIKEL